MWRGGGHKAVLPVTMVLGRARLEPPHTVHRAQPRRGELEAGAVGARPPCRTVVHGHDVRTTPRWTREVGVPVNVENGGATKVRVQPDS
jgi:hypothetical protein